MSSPETKAEEIARLQREIVERQMRLQYLILGDPTQCVSIPTSWYNPARDAAAPVGVTGFCGSFTITR